MAEIYVSTDVEADGAPSGPNSTRRFDPKSVVVVPTRFPDGQLYDLYTRDDVYCSLADEAESEALAAELIAAGAEVVDPQVWAERGRAFMEHSPLWTTRRDQYVLASCTENEELPRIEIFHLDGSGYEVEPALFERVIARMLEAGVEVVKRDHLDAVLADRRERQRLEEEHEALIRANCFAEQIPRRWRRRRVECVESPGDGPIPKRGEPGFEEFVARDFRGKLTFAEVREENPGLIAQMEPGDELWYFRSPAVCWERLAGRAGYCVVRNGRSVAHRITIVS